MIETNLAAPTNIKTDYKRGIVCIGLVRVAEWKRVGADNQLSIDPVKLKETGIDIDPTNIDDAVAEMLRE